MVIGFVSVVEEMGSGFMPVARTILIVLILFVVFNILLGMARKSLLKRARTKKQISNTEIFTKIARYVLFIVIIVFAMLSYGGSWTGFGVVAGLMTAALGWALQRPITGVAAWIMVVWRRPFEIGDRIIVAGFRGDVADIGLTHIYLKEVGGIATSEENSGRTIMIPNSILFEQVIINYTLEDEYILDEVVMSVTYDSDLDKASEIGIKASEKVLKKFGEHSKEKPYVRTYFQPSGINVHARYFVPTRVRQEVSSEITREMHKMVQECKGVEFAYPHTEIVVKERKSVEKK